MRREVNQRFSYMSRGRQEFEFEDVRRLFITPSTSNNSSGSQPVSSEHDLRAEEEGYIRYAKHNT